MTVVHHFSEEPAITVFEPHVPPTNPKQTPAVWAIDAEHAPLYWFPRNCPRATVWPRGGEAAAPEHRTVFENAFATAAPRVHAIEFGWLERMQNTQLFRYDFDASTFGPWEDAVGQWITHETVHPLAVHPVGDLLALHNEAGIELRLVPSLRAFVELVVDDRWDFSVVRLANALDA